MELSAIERLPNELLDFIFALVQPADLLCLRQMSRRLNDCTIDSVSCSHRCDCRTDDLWVKPSSDVLTFAGISATINPYIPQVAEHFFSEMTTSVMGSSLQRLEAISYHPRFSKSLKCLTIQDECESVDPHNEERALSATEIWPRDEFGFVLSDHIELQRVRQIFHSKRLSLSMIRIRSYEIHAPLLIFCPEFVKQQHSQSREASYSTTKPVCRLARDFLDGTHLAITAIRLERVGFYFNESGIYEPTSTLRELFDRHTSISDTGTLDLQPPDCWDMVFSIERDEWDFEGQLTYLTSAHINTDTYWLNRVMRAPLLESLRLWDARDNATGSHTIEYPDVSATKLKSLDLTGVRIPINRLFKFLQSPEMDTLRIWNAHYPVTQSEPSKTLPAGFKSLELRGVDIMPTDLMNLLENSRSTLCKLDLTLVQLHPGPSWREVLGSFARNASALQHFTLFRICVPLEDTPGQWRCAYFQRFSRDLLPAQCTGELNMRWRGGTSMRCFNIDYTGSHAGQALEQLANYMIC